MMAEIRLTPRELLYIAALLDVPEFIGISDAFYGMDELEMRHEITSLQISLTKKGYAEMGFDGGFTLKNEVRETVDVCAACDTLIVADKNKAAAPQIRELYYAKNGQIIKMDEEDGVKILLPVSNADDLLGVIIRDIKWQANVNLLANVTMSNFILSNATGQLGESDLTEGIKILMANDCDELSARTIINGLIGTSDYYAVSVTVFEGVNEGTNSVMLIDSKDGIYKMTPITKDDTDFVQFDALTAKQAEVSLADLIHDCLIRRGEV